MTYLPPINGGRVNVTIGGNTAGAGNLISSGTATLVGGNNITLSQNGNAITISGGAAGGGSNSFGMSNLGNTLGTSGIVSGSAVRYAFAGGNNVTLSQSINGSSGTVTISAANQTVQTQNLHNVTLAGNTAGAMAQISSGTLTLAGGNNVTLSQNGNAVTISAGAGGGGGGIALANAETTYTSGTANLAVAGGALTIASTTGQSFNFSVPQTSSLSGTGAVNISTNGSTISIGAPAFSAGVSTLGNTAGNTGTASNQVVFAGGNNVTLSQATGAGGNTISINAAGGGGGGAATISRWEYPNQGYSTMANGVGVQSSLSLQHVYIPFNLSASAAKIGGLLTVATFSSLTTANANYSLHMGIYSLNGSTLSLMTSGSASHSFSWGNTANAQYTQTITGYRQLTAPLDVTAVTPGHYWIGAFFNSATTYTGTSNALTMLVNTMVHATGVLGVIGSSTSAGEDILLGQGIYTSTVSSLPASIPIASVNNVAASNVQRAAFYHAMYNATY